MDSSSREAQWLLAEKYGNTPTHEYKRDLERLAAGEPLAYVIGHIPFLDTVIDLSKRPLIPRPETEFWVGRAIGEIRTMSGNRPLRILDAFAGSGCIGIALLKHLPNTVVDFADTSDAALEQIAINVKRNGITEERTHILKSDVFSNTRGPYDLIFANAPYIDRERNETQASVISHEPHEALFAPENGLYFIHRLIDEAPGFLAPGGSLYIEFDTWQKKDIEGLLHISQFTKWLFKRDQYDAWRTVLCTMPQLAA